MTTRLLAVGLAMTAMLAAPALAGAEDRASSAPYTLRPEWSVESTRAGRAHVIGYLYNTSGTMDAANVLLRVDQLGAQGQVTRTQVSRVFGDVRARGRLAFEVPLASVAPEVRVVVESVDWVHECR